MMIVEAGFMAKRNTYKRKKYEANPMREKPGKRAKKLRKRNIAIPLLVVLALIIIYAVLASPLFVVKQIEITGAQRADIAEAVYAELEKQRGGSILGFVPANHIFWLDLGGANEKITDPYVASISIEKAPPNKVRVSVIQRVPRATYTYEGSTYYLDQNAEIIELVRQTDPEEGSGPIGLPYITSTSTETLLGNLDIEKLNFINTFYTEFPKQLPDVQLLGFELEQGSQDTKVSTSASWDILLDTSNNPIVQLSNMIRTLKEKIPIDQRGRLEYIDVRLENFVYYK